MTGIFCTSAEMAADMRRAGFDMLVLANDAAILRGAMMQWATQAREG
jgi:2-keto-3-deoxy-L-rhamnonate aldolase RhmA